MNSSWSSSVKVAKRLRHGFPILCMLEVFLHIAPDIPPSVPERASFPTVFSVGDNLRLQAPVDPDD